MTVATHKTGMADVVDAATVNAGQVLISHLRQMYTQASASAEEMFNQRRAQSCFLCAASSLGPLIETLHNFKHLLDTCDDPDSVGQYGEKFWSFLCDSVENTVILASMLDVIEKGGPAEDRTAVDAAVEGITLTVKAKDLRETKTLKDRIQSITTACERGFRDAAAATA